ncbi:hypothetical protein H1S01_17795 [Heliobacterium chlorum]|uniref:Uncharacterized protein n=1 Tax=Heliobacterium chlorum TaxID=2698 RepID=A0ABR7T7H0_HELCL|nr:hypothetical protein [Heliobacterium chlorum]MBC9786315.1 hypothetical protein [Heliobacterium chlorum]
MSESKKPYERRIIPPGLMDKLPLRNRISRVTVIDRPEAPIARSRVLTTITYAAGVIIALFLTATVVSLIGSALLWLYFSLTSGGKSPSPM